MASFLSIGNNRYYEGSIVRALEGAWECEICRPDKLLRIAVLNWKKNGTCSVGLYSPEEFGHWHNLDEMVPNHTGYWIEEHQLLELFVLEPMRLEVTSNFTVRGKNLKGLKGTYLCPFDDSSSNIMSHHKVYNPREIFVELDENIGGSGCDGLGKKGHCVMVSAESVKFEDQKMATRLRLTR